MPSYRYPGPRPFEETDISLFFGRDKDKKNLLTFIAVEPLVVIFSKSGLGKSSLVNAAIIPELRTKNYEIILCRFNSYVGKEHDNNLNYESLSPSQKVLNEITAKYGTQKTFLDGLSAGTGQTSLWHRFKNLQITDGGKKIYFIFFDQFEELFTYPPEQVKEFKENLAELLSTSIPQEYLDQINKSESDATSVNLTDEELGLLYAPIPVKLLFTIRSDKFSLLTNLRDAIPGMVTKTYELKPFNKPEATNAIKNPALIEDNTVEGNFISNAFTYDDAAIQKMLNYLTDEGTEDIESFQLQVLCRYVEDIVIEGKSRNNELHTITADQLGDIKNVFEEYYNKLIGGIDKDEIPNVKKLFEEGLIFEKDKIRLPLYKGQITSTYGVNEGLLEKLVNTHLIRCEPDANGKDKYELSHDSLIEPILKAKEIRMAEEKEKENLVKQQEDQERQLKIKEDERKKLEAQLQMQRLQSRNRVFTVLIIFIVLIGGLVFYIIQRTNKVNVLSVQFRSDEKDWFYQLDAWQQDKVLSKGFLLLKSKDSIRYDDIKYSYKCAAYANLNSESNFLLALQFAQEGFLKDSNAVIKKSFVSLVNKPNLHIPFVKIKYAGTLNNATITRDEKYIFATSKGGIFKYDANTGIIKDSFTDAIYRSDYSAFSHNGDYVVYETFDNETTYLLRLQTRKPILIKNYYYSLYTRSIAFDIAPGNAFFIHASASDTVSVLTMNGRVIRKYAFPISYNDNINEVSISPDTNYFAAGTIKGEVFLVDLKNRDSEKNPQLLTTAFKEELHTDMVNSVSFSHNGKLLLTGSVDGKVQIWDIKNNRILQTIDLANKYAAITRCKFSDDDQHILIGEGQSGMISQWTKQKQSSNVLNIQSDTVKFNKDSLQLFGLDSNITSINFYNNDSKIIASSNHEISLWNLNSSKETPLAIKDVMQGNAIPPFTLNDKIRYNLITSLRELFTLTKKKQVLESIKLLNDSLNNISVDYGKQAVIELSDLIPQLYYHLKDCKGDTLNRLDSFNLFNYVANSYVYKISLDQDSLNGNFGKEHLEKLIEFRQKPFELDTALDECFDNLLSAYAIPVYYYKRQDQYDSALYWNIKMVEDYPQLKKIDTIQNALSIVYQNQVSLNISTLDFFGAKKSLEEWPDPHERLSYVLSKELVEICTNPSHVFNKKKLSSAQEKFDLEDVDNKKSITSMDAVLLNLIDNKTIKDQNIMDDLIKFDDYVYSISY